MKDTEERLDNSEDPVIHDSMDIPGVSEDGMDVSETVDTSDISGIQKSVQLCTLHFECYNNGSKHSLVCISNVLPQHSVLKVMRE